MIVAIDFYLLSNPLVFEEFFFTSLDRAVLVTALAVTVTLPWAPVPRVSRSMAAFLAWGLASAAWSITPSTTLMFWLQAAAAAAVAVAVASQLQPLVLVEGLVLGGVLVATLSWYAHLTGMVNASFLTLDGDTGIAGVGTNRNILAYTLAISFAALVAHVPAGWPGRLAWCGSMGLIGFTLYSADSTTGYSSAVAALAMSLSVIAIGRIGGAVASPLRRWAILGGSVTGLLAVFYGLAKVGGEDIFSFSGRLPIWKAGWHVAQDQLFNGYGWGAVWAHPWAAAGPNPVAVRIYAEAGLFLSHGHNSLMDVLVELGLVGVALVLVIYGTVLVNGLRSAARQADHAAEGPYARILLATLAALAVSGISEPMSVIPLGWWTVLLLLLLAPPRSPRSDDARDAEASAAAASGPHADAFEAVTVD